MTKNIAGNFMGRAVKVELGLNKKGIPELKIDFEITDGEHKGRKVPYSGLFVAKAIKYTKSAMLELGWAGKDANTVVADVMKAAKTVAIGVEVASWTNPDTGELREWSTVRNVGTYSAPLEPLAAANLKDVNSWLAEAGDSSTSNGASNSNDIPF